MTTCSLAGVGHGCALLWVLTTSMLALFVVQELCVRLGTAGRMSLSEGLAEELPPGPGRVLTLGLVAVAIGAGCAAYQAGNLGGASEGLRAVLGVSNLACFSVVAGSAALILTLARRIEALTRVLMVLIAFMTVAFVSAAVAAKPAIGDLLRGLSVPSVPSLGGRDTFLLVAGLVGTTIVPYNLFLHSALVRDRTKGPEDLPRERRDMMIFLPLGVLASMSVMVTASSFHGEEGAPRNLFEMGRALEPLLGPAGPWVFGLGVFAAGLSSALTAPLAAGLTLAPWFPERPRVPIAVSWCVMAIGLAFGLRAVLSAEGEGSPTQLILTAQVTNALLLPIALAFLWWMARRPRLGRWRAGPLASTAGGVVVLLGFALAIRTAMKIAG